MWARPEGKADICNKQVSGCFLRGELGVTEPGHSVHLLYLDTDYQVHLVSMTQGRLLYSKGKDRYLHVCPMYVCDVSVHTLLKRKFLMSATRQDISTQERAEPRW